MSKEADESYFEEFFDFVNDLMEGKYPYEELFKKYTYVEILDIISHSSTTVFLTLARMDTEMDFVAKLLHLIKYIRSGNEEYKNMDAGINMYNKMTNLLVRELYTQIKLISEMGYDEELMKTFKDLARDIEEIINEREDFNASTTNK